MSEDHDLESFSNEAGYIRYFLQKEALQQQANGVSRTVVIVNDPDPATAPGTKPIEGYFTLEANVIKTAQLALDVYTWPEIPVVWLAFLGRDLRRKGQGYGDALLIEALRRAEGVSRIIGVAGVALYALPDAVNLYHRNGFVSFDDEPMRMFLPIQVIRKIHAIAHNPFNIETD